jgi:hypothetical protein
MKRNKLTIAGTGLVIAGLAVFGVTKWQNAATSHYTLSNPVAKLKSATETEGAAGAGQWWFDRVKNPAGQLDYAAMYEVAQRAHQTAMQRNNNPSTASVNWTELGPDNVGGRTRALIIDRQNDQHMFAGGVSGGLWESTDGGNNWFQNSFNSTSGAFLTVASMTQGVDNAIYVGTGEGLYYFIGNGVGGFIGGGIWKSTDNGASWTLLTSTQPASDNNNTVAWAAVNKLAADPADPNKIYAATNRGLRRTLDGGVTWNTVTGPGASSESSDVDVASNGNVIGVVSSKPWLSVDGGNTFTNVGLAANQFYSASLTRTEIAFSPSDPNYVYAFCAKSGNGASGILAGAYISINGGNNWTQIAGASSAQFDPFGTGQGDYDNTIAVDPSNPGRAFFGGVELWKWELANVPDANNPPAGQWTRTALEFPNSPFNPYYVHSDKHIILFHPTNANTFFVGCDGGVFRTVNKGQTYVPMNNGYNVTQMYSIAHDHPGTGNLPGRDYAVGGTQDNGTLFIDGSGNTPMSAISVSGGDGGHCEISFLNPSATFTTVYYGALDRASTRGQFGSQFYSDRINALAGFGTSTFASFVTPIRLWESGDDPMSHDSITFTNAEWIESKHLTTGATASFSGLLTPSQQASPSPTVILNTVIFTDGVDSLFSNGAGVFSGDGSGTILANGTYNITFNNTPPANRVVKAIYHVQYGAGSILTLASGQVPGRNFLYTTPTQINDGDVITIQDRVQTRFVVGFSGTNGIWMTKRPLDFSTNPDWFKIAGPNSLPNGITGGEPNAFAYSADGNHLFVGYNNGNLYRISNLSMVTDSTTGDVALANPNAVVTCTRIGAFGSRYITAIDCDPNNAENVVVSLGNYGNTTYVQYSNNAVSATSSTGTFVNKTGNMNTLGAVPALSITFDKYQPNRVLVGTEHGVFETSNITAASVTWTDANAGFANVAVDMLRQQRNEPWHVSNAGCIYAGTHGRGMWRDDSSWQQPTGINEPNQSGNGASINNDLKVFPNPVFDGANVSFRLDRAGDVTVQIYDLTGKLVSDQEYNNLTAGNNTVKFDASALAKGTYLITVIQNNKRVGTGRFVKMMN